MAGNSSLWPNSRPEQGSPPTQILPALALLPDTPRPLSSSEGSTLVPGLLRYRAGPYRSANTPPGVNCRHATRRRAACAAEPGPGLWQVCRAAAGGRSCVLSSTAHRTRQQWEAGFHTARKEHRPEGGTPSASEGLGPESPLPCSRGPDASTPPGQRARSDQARKRSPGPAGWGPLPCAWPGVGNSRGCQSPRCRRGRLPLCDPTCVGTRGHAPRRTGVGKGRARARGADALGVRPASRSSCRATYLSVAEVGPYFLSQGTMFLEEEDQACQTATGPEPGDWAGAAAQGLGAAPRPLSPPHHGRSASGSAGTSGRLGFLLPLCTAWTNTTNGKPPHVAAGTGPASNHTPHSSGRRGENALAVTGEWVWNQPRGVISTRFPQTPPRQKGPSADKRPSHFI